jgi:hypothetical protein
MKMSNLPIDPSEEQEEETFFGSMVLKVIITFLCGFLGFAFVIEGYAVAIVLDLNILEFSAFTSFYFVISIGIWIVIGLCTPFTVISGLFEVLKRMTAVNVVFIILAVAVFVLLYWFLIAYCVSFIISVFGIAY